MAGFFTSHFVRDGDSSVFRDIFFKCPFGMCVLTHPDFEIKLINESFAGLCGRKKGDLSGRLFSSVWEKGSVRDEFFTKLRTEGFADDFEASFLNPGGKKRDVFVSGSVIDDENYLICAVLS